MIYLIKVTQAQELHIFKCPNCGCGIIIIHDGKSEELYCPYCKEKLNQPGDNYNEL